MRRALCAATFLMSGLLSSCQDAPARSVEYYRANPDELTEAHRRCWETQWQGEDCAAAKIVFDEQTAHAADEINDAIREGTRKGVANAEAALKAKERK